MFIVTRLTPDSLFGLKTAEFGEARALVLPIDPLHLLVLCGSTRSVAFATAPRLAVLARVPRYLSLSTATQPFLDATKRLA
jgi:hypothetical protein